jgi:aminoglycoside phosphotransferase family enzyme/predicted kinase
MVPISFAGPTMTLEAHQTLVRQFAALFEGAEVLQTHISSIVITPERVYKFKKPVDFGFLDYTSLEKRRHFCEEEIRLGTLGAPGLYLGVVPVYGAVERPSLQAKGAPVEYAVCMRRFEEEAQLDNLLEAGGLQSGQIDAIAQKLAQFHCEAEPAAKESVFGEPETVLVPMLENIDHLDELLGEGDASTLETIRSWTVREHKRRTPLIRKRKAAGFVKECHGDLHLRNMALYEGVIIFFDPIEFNEKLRHIDTISDLAFLLMDLEARGRPQFANRLLSLYLEENGDYEGVALLPLYKVYRAMVRAKVAALQLPQRTDPAEKEAIARESREYMKLALSFLKKPESFLAVMHGFSGSGKSVAALRLVERAGAIRLRSDRERLRLFTEEEGRYAPDATERTYARLAEIARSLLLEGERVVADATFLRRWQRDLFYRLGEELGVSLFLFHAEAPESVLFERVAAREGEKRDISEATAEVLKLQLSRNDPLQNDEEKHLVVLNTESPERLEADIERWLEGVGS